MATSNIEQRLLAGSQNIFAKFCAGLAKVDPLTAGLFGLSAGALTYAAGFGVEVAHQASILSSGGKEALEAYRAIVPDTTLKYLGRALAGELASTGQNIQGAGVWMMMSLPGVAAISAKLIKQFGESHAAPQEPERPRGATKVQFSEALQRTLEGVQNEQKTEARPSRGLQ